MSSAPDYPQPLVGWRVWLVVRRESTLRLRSVLHETIWTPGREVTARCLDRLVILPGRRVRHEAPAENCRCGVYASRTVGEALAYLDGYTLGGQGVLHRAVGLVSLWGAVVECERGWRGGHAYPARLFVPVRRPNGGEASSAAETALALVDYGVPVELVDAGTSAELAAALALDRAA